MGHGSFSPGNAEGGLTTLEEKSLGAYAKSGRGPIHGVMQLPELQDVRVVLVGIVKTVVRLGQTLVVLNHQRGTEFIVGLTNLLKSRVSLPVLREWEGFEAIGRCVAKIVFHR